METKLVTRWFDVLALICVLLRNLKGLYLFCLWFNFTLRNPKCPLLSQLWEIICSEHGIDEEGRYIGNCNSQLEKIDVYFAEGAGE